MGEKTIHSYEVTHKTGGDQVSSSGRCLTIGYTLFFIPQEITTHEVIEYSEQDLTTHIATLSKWAEAVGEQDLGEERFEMHCQESQTDIESSYYH